MAKEAVNDKWIQVMKSGDYDAMGRRHGISPVIARLLINRGVAEEEFDTYLKGELKELHDPRLMKDMEKALDILTDKLRKSCRIRVIGDYDVDGVFSSYILERTLKDCWLSLNHKAPGEPGQEMEPDQEMDQEMNPDQEKAPGPESAPLVPPIDTVLPHRIRDGFGLNENLVRQAAQDGVDTIITCDNGIAAIQEAELAGRLGITLIVTDHHMPPRDAEGRQLLPEAAAVVDHKREDCPYPFKELCGAGIAFKLSQLLYQTLTSEDPMKHLDMAAFATVEDIVSLRDENRIIVKHGLKVLMDTKNTGLRCLFEALGYGPRKRIDTTALGFFLGPCINAAGRLEDAMTARSLLDAADRDEAENITRHLLELNDERKNLTEKGFAAARRQIEGQALASILVAYIGDCHESIAGIVAGRLTEAYSRPALVLTRSEQGLKGSARSIPACNIYEALTGVKDIFSKYGGHSGAAGFSINAGDEEERLEKCSELSRRLNERAQLGEDDLKKSIRLDMALPLGFVTPALAASLDALEPWGMDFEAPLFGETKVSFRDFSMPGTGGKVLKAMVSSGGSPWIPAVAFADAAAMREQLMSKPEWTIAYRPQINSYDGSLQLLIEFYK